MSMLPQIALAQVEGMLDIILVEDGAPLHLSSSVNKKSIS
jgi:ADP-heptose:LPS heptosyltransferase